MVVFNRTADSIAREAQSALERERAGMIVYRLAFRAALRATPYGEAHALAAIDAYVAALDQYDTIRMAWEDATLFERPLALVEDLRAGLGFTAEQMDDVFRLAKQIESGG